MACDAAKQKKAVFAPFFKEPADATMRRYYIKGDVHFTPAGNQLIFETVRQAVDGNW